MTRGNVVKKLLACLIGAVLLVSGTAAVHADSLPGEQFTVGNPGTGVPSVGVVIDDSQKIKNPFATLQAFTGSGSGNTGKVLSVKDCARFGDEGCESDKFFNYKAAFDYCSTEITFNCVTEVSATDESGKVVRANFVESFPGKQKGSYIGDPAANLPNGGSTFIVDFPTIPHSHGTKYLIVSAMDGKKEGSEKKFTATSFSTAIFAVDLVDGQYTVPQTSTDVKFFPVIGAVSNSRIPFDNLSGKIATCAQVTTSRCARAWPLPLNVSFSVSLKLRVSIQGWLHGRISDVSAQLTKASDGDQLLTVSGKPLTVPIVYQWFPKAGMPASIKDFYAFNQGTGYSFDEQGTGFGSTPGKPDSILKDYIDYTASFFKEASAWYGAIGDKSQFTSTAWSFRTITEGNIGQGCAVKDDQLSGVVTTNSNMFLAEPPTFNRQDMTLDYSVSSPHFLPDGTVFKGTYNLLIRSDFARCIYKFTTAPISATISIVSADGTSQVATQVMGEKNGWLFLSANNFTFSSPTVKVKLTQEAAPVATPKETTTPVANARALNKSTITCIKGKTTKKITGIKPACPAGYKKK